MRNIRKIIISLIVLGTLAGSVGAHRIGEIPDEYQPLYGLVIGQKVNARKAREFIGAVVQADESRDWIGLRAWQEDEEEIVALMAGAFLVLAEPGQTLRRIQRLLKEGKGSAKAHVVTLSLLSRKKAVDLLLREWKRTEDEELSRIIEVALRSQTGKELGSWEKWAAWWEENRKKTVLRKVETFDQMVSRIEAATNLALASELRKALAKLDGPLGEGIAEIFDGIAQLNRLGLERENALAEEGDHHFSHGEFQEAQLAYAKAMERFPDDLKSAFLWACLEMEAGRWASARGKLVPIAERTKAPAARYLVALCQAREANGTESLLEAAVRVAQSMPKADFAQSWLDDIVIARVLGQYMVRRGVLHPGVERIAEVGAANSDDLEVQIGVALRLGRQQRQVQIDGVLARFPEEPFALSQAVRVRRIPVAGDEKREAELLALSRRWREMEPENLLPHLVAILGEHLENAPNDKFARRLPEPAWAEILEKSSALEMDDWEAAAVAAQRRVATMAGHPFAWMLDAAATLGIEHALASAARTRIRELAEKEDFTEIDRTVGVIEKVCDFESARTSMAYLIRRASCAVVWDERVKQLREHGREEEAARRESEKPDLKEMKARMMETIRILGALSSLPIPSLQNELGPLLHLRAAQALEIVAPVQRR